MNHLIYAVILLAGLVAIPTAKADTLICQTTWEYPPRVLIISMKDKAIKNINSSQERQSYVKYHDGRKIYLSSNSFNCHETMGKNDEKEQELVDMMVNMITGEGLE